MPADISVTLRLSPLAIEAVVLLLDAEVEAVDDLIAEEARRGATARFLAEMRTVREHWESLRAPIAAALRAHEQPAVSGEICSDAADHVRLQQRCDDDGFPRVCESCGRRFERVDF